MPDGEIHHGNVFWIGSESLGGGKHRHIVASDHSRDSKVVLLPITTWEDWKDDSCIITRREYTPLRHDSCIDYRYGKIVPIETIKRGVASGNIKRCPNVPPELLTKVLACALDSQFLPSGCLDMLNKQGLVK